jgi:hypothetical protein
MDRVIDRTGGTGEVEDVVDRAYIERFANVFFYKLESRLMAKMFEVSAASSQQIINNDHAPAFGEKSVAEMGSQKSCTTSDQSAL